LAVLRHVAAQPRARRQDDGRQLSQPVRWIMRLPKMQTALKPMHRPRRTSSPTAQIQASTAPDRTHRTGAALRPGLWQRGCTHIEAAARQHLGHGARAQLALAAYARPRLYASDSDIGDAESISKSYVSRIMRLALLAPDIIETILAGGADYALTLETLERPLPVSWEEQGE
jgi:hypothetical protein